MLPQISPSSFIFFLGISLLSAGGCSPDPVKYTRKNLEPSQILSKKRPALKKPSSSAMIPSSNTTEFSSSDSLPRDTPPLPVDLKLTGSQRVFLSTSKEDIQSELEVFREGCKNFRSGLDTTPPAPAEKWKLFPQCQPHQSTSPLAVEQASVAAANLYCHETLAPSYCTRARGTFKQFCLQDLKTICGPELTP